MFTGIIESLGKISKLDQTSAGEIRFELEPLDEFTGVTLGESIAVNGACLTVETTAPLRFFVSQETLEKTNLKNLCVGSTVNLERALRMGDRLSGHWVLGHVDGFAKLTHLKPNQDSYDLRVELPALFSKYLVEKGSITLNGVSLTINSLQSSGSSALVDIRIIPHTFENTNFKTLKSGESINFEVDILAKHVEKLLKREPHGK